MIAAIECFTRCARMDAIGVTPHYRHMQGRLAPFRAKVRAEHGRPSVEDVIGWVE